MGKHRKARIIAKINSMIDMEMENANAVELNFLKYFEDETVSNVKNTLPPDHDFDDIFIRLIKDAVLNNIFGINKFDAERTFTKDDIAYLIDLKFKRSRYIYNAEALQRAKEVIKETWDE